MKNIVYLFSMISVLLCIQNCNKLKNKVKENMKVPDYSYKDAKIDDFYYVIETEGSSNIVPLIKPFDLIKAGSPQEWQLATYDLPNELGNVITPVTSINVFQIYIYGYKPFENGMSGPEFDSPEKWFILNAKDRKLTFFDKELDFKMEIKKLNLPDHLLNPDAVFEEYKNQRILSWFPENIKKQLEKVKK
ncbi:hypothetical protein [Chryseobacterium sp. Marseille-Q3244]|uniref:hypothetical protein n=1 Tax=Chryseobacterium sp. Marseille-Q3244 TaxID=2758092 RepID=UPI0020259806|nr:hypothetical protein [Chryseobacterium sp. Marseille-Q3244]